MSWMPFAAIDRNDIADYVDALFLVYLILIFVRILLSWIPRIPYNPVLQRGRSASSTTSRTRICASSGASCRRSAAAGSRSTSARSSRSSCCSSCGRSSSARSSPADPGRPARTLQRHGGRAKSDWRCGRGPSPWSASSWRSTRSRSSSSIDHVAPRRPGRARSSASRSRTCATAASRSACWRGRATRSCWRCTLGALALLVVYFAAHAPRPGCGWRSGWWSAARSATSPTGCGSAPRSTSSTLRCGRPSTSPTSRSWPVWPARAAIAARAATEQRWRVGMS